MAFLDRIVDGAIIVKINGKSYRAHRARSPVETCDILTFKCYSVSHEPIPPPFPSWGITPRARLSDIFSYKIQINNA